MASQPWQEKWKRGDQLGQGGQGTTFLVTSIEDPARRGVLKTLKSGNNPQARGRMHMEVVSLGVLAKEGLKVPCVLDSNTARYDEPGLPLYFVMEYIEGSTLAKAIKQSGALPLDKAAAVVLDLAATVGAGHKSNVLHRDLKPDNILVRGLEPADMVIVDYGLSFNEEELDGETLTHSGDQFRNRFLSLPETNTLGGDLRDKRTDVTALSAILYFCLTGHYPGHLQDGAGRPPHRRSTYDTRQKLKSDERCQAVELLLDQGFAVELEYRFQSCEEFIARLKRALAPPKNISDEDPVNVAAEISRLLLKKDRVTQLANYAQCIGKVRDTIVQHLNGTISKMRGPFHFAIFTPPRWPVPFPAQGQETGQRLAIGITLNPHGFTRQVCLAFAVQGNQCQMLRSVAAARQSAGAAWTSPPAASNWEDLEGFDPMNPPDPSVLLRHMDASLNQAMWDLQREALQQ